MKTTLLLLMASVIWGQEAPVERIGPPEIYSHANSPGEANPDITQQDIAETICNKDWKTGSIRPPAAYTTKLKKKQMLEYGFTVPDPKKKCMPNSNNTKCYEQDHVISITLAGSPTSPRNLDPEPYNSIVNGMVIGAKTKDLVELFLANATCYDIPNAKHESSKFKATKSITLARAQEIISGDWYACYLSLLAGLDCE